MTPKGNLNCRLKPDPALGLRDLMKPIMDWLQEKGSHDMLTLLEPATGEVTWKTRPLPDWLANLVPLLRKLVAVDKKCIFPQKKMQEALEKIQADHYRINFSKLRDDQFMDKCSLYIRAAASQMRDLKAKGGIYQRAMKRASLKEKQALDGLLDEMVLPHEKEEEAELEGEVQVSKGPAKKIGPGPCLSPPKTIFRRILTKSPSNPDPPKETSLALVPYNPTQQSMAASGPDF